MKGLAGLVQKGLVSGNTLGWSRGGQFWPMSSGDKSFRRRFARARVLPRFEPGRLAQRGVGVHDSLCHKPTRRLRMEHQLWEGEAWAVGCALLPAPEELAGA